MAWKCSCGGLNSDYYQKCSSCGIPRGAGRTPQVFKTPTEAASAIASHHKSKKKTTEWIWPKITDLESAKEAGRQGFWAATLVAVLTAALAVLGYLGFQILLGLNLWALVDAALFAVIAWGIHRMSRTAAIAGLGLYIFERVDMWLTYGVQNPVMMLIFILMFINSIRGTFAYRNLIGHQIQKAKAA